MGLAILGYCPGTSAGAAGQGALDALFGGIGGMVAGGMIYTRIYPRVSKEIHRWGDFGQLTITELLNIQIPAVMLGLTVCILLLFTTLELAGF